MSNRYDRLLSLSSFSKEDLKTLQSKNVLIIGVGGVGQHIATYLVTNGVEHIAIVDFDNVENKSDFEINGSVLLRDLKEDLHIPLESNINETIGGWFAEQIDRMPQTGDTVEFEGFLFSIKKIQAHRVERIQISKLQKKEEEAEE